MSIVIICIYPKIKTYIILNFYLILESGKSGNAIIDDFILKNELRWIPYNKFKNVKYLNEGGFGTIYKAVWLGYEEVILKCHRNLNENLNEFLEEWEYHISVLSSNDIIYFYGFTKDPNTSKYMVVIDYANKGNLRENLTRIVKNNWNQKLYILYEIISGLSEIHEKSLIHCDFHDGNILNHNYKNKDKIYISDLGLCQPVKSFLKKYDIYGVIPFMAPEVLKGKSYTPASDIYSFSMIMWEFTSGVPPFNNRAHDIQLSLSICKGERPKIIENTPQCYVDLMKKCWNENPLKRPSSKEVLKIIEKWIFRPFEVSEELKSNLMEFINAPIGHNNLATKYHPKACYKSRLLDFTSKKLNEILESEDSQAYYASHFSSEEVNEMPISEDLNDCIVNDMKSLDIKTD
ncbi:kinase-like domain-containing protein [Rhizophagus irregularis DAOM 181602=DAOM 197198]|uniref:Kinase-like domain-containing protein n=1 Tax=Rhizophagus irregularis (strain DAOM 181602 / DAOM 197198 / MUCL 43194) TaxID=747089 RepID=A0A2P4NSB4_RHIID|nr:kinase-like domain-containing protein [Rhizophagus irregularis DAOM 181602=DAOM 197198]POG56046.1 kinase-like domain-containing protein [Rhizophagus irregularis DAOM 181602=DAOM 197198]GBC18988.2 kinase-like domain-containing protein [Rhizophagus irregularis DAOM 181602=DAOM 197198]|eukprot:XP_025164306.1 kinase-like domain-containing protein [Rhizophagus irregularis DAOM 181602=DAOM 197198]